MNLHSNTEFGINPFGRALKAYLPVKLAICVLLAGLILPQSLSAETLNKQVNATLKQLPKWIEPPDFDYNPENLPDPFQRFLKLDSEKDEDQESKKEKQAMTPLERVKPDQVKIKGIMWYPDNPEGAIALVELPNGKGYTLEKNTRIGDNKGRVTKIRPNKVIIKQQATDILGKNKTKTVVLELQKTSGENNE